MWFTVATVSASPSYLRSVPDVPAVARRRPVGSGGGRPRAERACARPGCTAGPVATLQYAYVAREAWLEPLALRREPGAHDLCALHAERTRAPNGWTLSDRRPRDPQPAAGIPPIDPGSDVAPDAPGPTPSGPEVVSEDRSAPAVAPGVDRGVDGGVPLGPAGPLVTRATRSSSVPAPRALIPRPEPVEPSPARPPVWDRSRTPAEVVVRAAPVAAPTAPVRSVTHGSGDRFVAAEAASTVLDAASGTAHPLPLAGITW